MVGRAPTGRAGVVGDERRIGLTRKRPAGFRRGFRRQVIWWRTRPPASFPAAREVRQVTQNRLSSAALVVLERADGLRRRSRGLVFPGIQGKIVRGAPALFRPNRIAARTAVPAAGFGHTVRLRQHPKLNPHHLDAYMRRGYGGWGAAIERMPFRALVEGRGIEPLAGRL